MTVPPGMPPAQMSGNTSPFDAIRRTGGDGERWSGRDLMPLLGYDSWRRFDDAVQRAKMACSNSGADATSHFADAVKVAASGPAGADYQLTRYAAYLVAMNGDPRKPEIAAAQTYFAVKTREAEVAVHAPVKPADVSRRDLALMVVAEADRADAEKARAEVAEQRVAELEPKAAAADALAEADGTLSMGAVANMFGIGRTTFFKLLRAERIVQGDRRPYQEYADWFRVTTGTHESSDGRRIVHHTSYLYAAGALRLHALLSKRGHSLRKPVIDGQLRLLDGGAA
jgi:DNA-damage-inducible protein D